jgi:hypothetical protein
VAPPSSCVPAWEGGVAGRWFVPAKGGGEAGAECPVRDRSAAVPGRRWEPPLVRWPSGRRRRACRTSLGHGAPLKLWAATPGRRRGSPQVRRSQGGGRDRRTSLGPRAPNGVRRFLGRRSGTAAFPCPQGGGGGLRICHGLLRIRASSGSKCGGAREEEKHRRFCYEPREEVGFSKKLICRRPLRGQWRGCRSG